MIKLFRCIKNWFFTRKYPFWKLSDEWYMYNTCLSDDRIGSKNFFVKYNFTWYDDIPNGWKKAFGKQLSKDIKKSGMPYIKQGKKWEDILSFQQIKEKWGELCLYASAVDEIQDVLEKYELMSSGYCIVCGKPARYKTRGWISFQCEKCFEKNDCWKYEDHKQVPLNDEEMKKHKEKCRLTQEDLPQITHYEYKVIKTETLNSKEEFDKRWDELWDSPDRPEDEVYHRVDNEDGTWTIEYQQRIEHIVDIKEEYGIDFEELWGLK